MLIFKYHCACIYQRAVIHIHLSMECYKHQHKYVHHPFCHDAGLGLSQVLIETNNP